MRSLNGLPISPAQVTATVNHQSGVSVISPRYQLLDTNLKPIQLGTAGPTGDYADISYLVPAGGGAKIDNNTTQSVHRTLNLTIQEPATIDFNTLRHLVKVFVDYWDSYGKLLFEVPVGVFTFILPDRTLGDAGNTWTLVGLDLTSWVAQLEFLNAWVIPAGVNYVAAITQILTTDALPKSLGGKGQTPAGLDDVGPNFPTSRIRIAPTTAITPTPIIFGAKDNKLTAVNALLASINYFPLWCDEDGNLRSDPMPYFTAALPGTSWTYSTDANSIIAPSISQIFNNQTGLANVANVICENNGRPVLTSTQYNNSSSSAISLTNLKRAIVRFVQDDQIPDQATCTLRAFVELQLAATSAETVKFTAMPNPFHQSHDFCALNVTSGSGVKEIQSPSGHPWEEQQWTMDLDKRTVDRTFGKVVAIG